MDVSLERVPEVKQAEARRRCLQALVGYPRASQERRWAEGKQADVTSSCEHRDVLQRVQPLRRSPRAEGAS